MVITHTVDGVRGDRELLAVRRGSYLLGAAGPPSRPGDRHLLAVHAAPPELAPDAVVSHVSA